MPVTLGRRSYIHFGQITNTFEAEVVVGSFTSIAKGLTVLAANAQHPSFYHKNLVANFPFDVYDYGPWPARPAVSRVEIGSDVWIGTDVTVIGNRAIGHGSVVGAGTIVTKDVPPYAVVSGNPGTVRRMRFDEPRVAALLRIKWWEWSDEQIRANLHHLHDVDRFIAQFDTPVSSDR